MASTVIKAREQVDPLKGVPPRVNAPGIIQPIAPPPRAPDVAVLPVAPVAPVVPAPPVAPAAPSKASGPWAAAPAGGLGTATHMGNTYTTDQQLLAAMSAGGQGPKWQQARLSQIQQFGGNANSFAPAAYSSLIDLTGGNPVLLMAAQKIKDGQTPEQVVAAIAAAAAANPHGDWASGAPSLADLQKMQGMFKQYGGADPAPDTTSQAQRDADRYPRGSPQNPVDAQGRQINPSTGQPYQGTGGGIVNAGIGANPAGGPAAPAGAVARDFAPSTWSQPAGSQPLVAGPNDPPTSDPNPGDGANYPVTDPRHWQNYPSQFSVESASTDPNIVNALAAFKAGQTDDQVYATLTRGGADLQGMSELFWRTEIAKGRAGLPEGYAPGAGPPPGGGPPPAGPDPLVGGPAGPPAENFQPVMGTVAPDQTVQGQLKDILTTGNPLLEGAKARAMQAANARGLQNTSMASQAGEEAIVNAALPIAQQDASTYEKQALANQDIANQFLSTRLGASLDLTKAYEAFKQQNYLFDKDSVLKRYISDSGNTSQEKIAALTRASQQALQDAHDQSTERIAGLSIAANKLLNEMGFTHQQVLNLQQNQQGMINLYSEQVSRIQTMDIEPDQKAAQIKQLNTIWASTPNFPLHLNIDVLDDIG